MKDAAKKTSKPAELSPAAAEKQLAGFIAKFDAKDQKRLRAARKIWREWFPTANELVYDNYNFLVIGYCSTEKATDCIGSLAAAAGLLNLNFPYVGASLPDPAKILRGSGGKNRFLRIESVHDFSRPEVKAVIDAAVKHLGTPLAKNGKGKLIIRAVVPKQRPRRALAKWRSQ